MGPCHKLSTSCIKGRNGNRVSRQRGLGHAAKVFFVVAKAEAGVEARSPNFQDLVN